MSPRPVICGYRRSPFHAAGRGALARTRPDELLAAVVRDLVASTGIDPGWVEDLIVGCAFPEAEQGFNIGRQVVTLAGLPITTAGVTVNRWCGSSMSAIHMAAGAIASGAGEMFICAGVESMSRVPMPGFNPMPNPRQMEDYPQAYMGMGETAENLAKRHDIPRIEQERYALQSHQRAAAASAAGHFAEEIVPILTDAGEVAADGTIRVGSTAEDLAKLSPAFLAEGTITAATSSPLTDGAAAVLIASEDAARAAGLPIWARLRAMAVVGCESSIMGIGPVPATKKALGRAHLELEDIDIIELNEAFAAQVLAVKAELGLDEAKLNLDGGAIALGHPLGASGARITGKAASLLRREGKSLALATACIGGGMGIATVLEAV